MKFRRQIKRRARPPLSQFRQIKRWSWEVYWIIQGFAAWIIAPTLLASIFVPHLRLILITAWHNDPSSIGYAVLWGVCWGVGGITFGLAIRDRKSTRLNSS